MWSNALTTALDHLPGKADRFGKLPVGNRLSSFVEWMSTKEAQFDAAVESMHNYYIKTTTEQVKRSGAGNFTSDRQHWIKEWTFTKQIASAFPIHIACGRNAAGESKDSVAGGGSRNANSSPEMKARLVSQVFAAHLAPQNCCAVHAIVANVLPGVLRPTLQHALTQC